MASAPVLTEPSREQAYQPRSAVTPQPVGEKERIVSIDVLRGFALLGILPMNIQYFSMISAAYSNPTAYGNMTGANYWVWLLCHVFADQKFMTIFSMLFGVGILLITSRIEAAGSSSSGLHYRRMGWLIAFGLAHAYLLWSGDILVTYGLCGLIVYLFRKLRPRTLLVVGLVAISVAPAVLTGYGVRAQHWSAQQVQIATEDLWKPTPAEVANEIKAYRGTWRDQMKFRVPDSVQMEITFFAGFTFWRVTGLMLVGMALFQLRFFTAKRPAAQYWAMIAVAACVGIPVTLYGTHRDFANGWDFRYSFFYGAQFNYWASILVSLGWVGVMILASRAAPLLAITRRLAAVGRMAFTNYIMHTVLCTTIFYGHGFGLFSKVERIWQFSIVVAIWAMQLALSPVWLKHFLFGPLEWLWRSLTYWQWEPFRRHTSPVGDAQPVLMKRSFL
ncbi:MAG TPA: DUF418 domain-containing protein [Candidatus Acidoferrales bacterium]|nr:DUF418 domain-containing protein [Candidatus Acidoferrales bacterium]